MKLIDLTHKFELPMPVWPGDPEPEFLALATVDADGYADAQLSTGLHVGTHIDAPAHMIAGGKNMADYPAERFVGRGVLVDARGKSTIDEQLLRNVNLQVGDIVLVLTGKSVEFGADSYYDRFPVFTEAFADKLIEAGVSMVGMDTPSPDAAPETDQEIYPIHNQLLGSDVLIAENVNHLEELANVGEFEVIALPVRLAANAAPARIIARIN